MSRLSRQEMKRDEVREVLSSTLTFVSENVKLVGMAVGGLLLLIAAGLVIAGVLRARQAEASNLLARAFEIRDASQVGELPAGASSSAAYADAAARRAAFREALEQLVAERPGSDAARVARANLAKLAFENGDLEAARQRWKEVAATGSDDALSAAAELNLVHLDRASGELDRAEERLRGMLDSGDAAMPRDVLLRELAITLEAAGAEEESRATYRRLLEEHPQSPYAAEARRETATIG